MTRETYQATHAANVAAHTEAERNGEVLAMPYVRRPPRRVCVLCGSTVRRLLFR